MHCRLGTSRDLLVWPREMVKGGEDSHRESADVSSSCVLLWAELEEGEVGNRELE